MASVGYLRYVQHWGSSLTLAKASCEAWPPHDNRPCSKPFNLQSAVHYEWLRWFRLSLLEQLQSCLRSQAATKMYMSLVLADLGTETGWHIVLQSACAPLPADHI